ncbi:ABC transporter ATP-binding protein [Ilumatobacter sp.]|uniref:ABC transporter ATP-binding protein n=1 Tax=Ilumatobacter sp. TaxID=1967498 RepID=UPI0037523292
MNTVVTVDDAHVRFGDAEAVDGVSLEVHAGEVLALVGESGSGKTTLVRAIQGIQSLSGGSIEVGKQRDVQMVFQDPTGALNPRHTIYEIVAEGLRIRRERADEKAKVATALSRAGLRPPERFMGLYPHEISGGQRQRVVIAGAMVMEPKVLLADEPVASLDASIRGEILALMRELVDESGLAIVAVTHDLGLAWNIADRIAVMYLGRIVEIGDTEEVLGGPQHPYTRALLSVVPEIDRMEPQVLTGEPPDPRKIPSGCRFHPRCPLVASGEAERLGILERCRGTDVALRVVSPTGSHHVACHAVDRSAT